jgi:hypothetical protein
MIGLSQMIGEQIDNKSLYWDSPFSETKSVNKGKYDYIFVFGIN